MTVTHPPQDAVDPANRVPRRPADLFAEALSAAAPRLALRTAQGTLLPLDVHRWCSEAAGADQPLLDRCRGPVLDVGCGPGRLVAALARRGTEVLGVDVTPSAGALARAAGATVLTASVFEALPGEGRWGTVILADGSIGIGGDPLTLLRRVRRLLDPSGLLLLEVEPHETHERLTVRLEDGEGECSAPFPWARLGPGAGRQVALRAGLRLREQWSAGGRRFLTLTPTTGDEQEPLTASLDDYAGVRTGRRPGGDDGAPSSTTDPAAVVPAAGRASKGRTR
ncbi:class I SAM-dependent methyltransferase [Kitasatospora indigofera]|uniref:class I SAM-dependent methyltransferase n=1 Tax=Kitasatospora indigofera TaxID=67307 RepID=UPI00362D5A61